MGEEQKNSGNDKQYGYCPLSFNGGKTKDKPCNDCCAWFVKGLNRCVLQGLNLNLSNIINEMKKIAGRP